MIGIGSIAAWFLGSRIGTGVLGALAVAAILGPMTWYLDSALEDAQEELVDTRAELQAVSENRDRLRQVLEEQNARIEEMQTESERIEEQAARAAATVLQGAREVREADARAGDTAEEMNRWMDGLFNGH